jgi:AraC-like DNA-binding protein
LEGSKIRIERKRSQFHVEDLQAVGLLSAVPQLVWSFGANPAEVLSSVGLSADALDDPEATIPYSAVGPLLEAAADRTRCEHFGLEAGKQIRTASLGLVGELVRNAPSIGVALLDFTANQHRNAHGSVAYLLPEGHHVLWGYAVYHSNIRGYDHICDWACMGGFSVLGELAGEGCKQVIEALFSRPEPKDMALYRRAFGVKLRFNAGQTALRLPGGLLERSVTGADSRLRTVLEERVAALWCAGRLDTVTQLRRVLRVALIKGEVTANHIAAQIGMSRRTLHRRLDAWGLRFQDVLDETRCGYAQQLLAYTQLTIGQITRIVGYADPSTLARKFVQWTGVPPSDWRSDYGHTH